MLVSTFHNPAGSRVVGTKDGGPKQAAVKNNNNECGRKSEVAGLVNDSSASSGQDHVTSAAPRNAKNGATVGTGRVGGDIAGSVRCFGTGRLGRAGPDELGDAGTCVERGGLLPLPITAASALALASATTTSANHPPVFRDAIRGLLECETRRNCTLARYRVAAPKTTDPPAICRSSMPSEGSTV